MSRHPQSPVAVRLRANSRSHSIPESVSADPHRNFLRIERLSIIKGMTLSRRVPRRALIQAAVVVPMLAGGARRSRGDIPDGGAGCKPLLRGAAAKLRISVTPGSSHRGAGNGRGREKSVHTHAREQIRWPQCKCPPGSRESETRMHYVIARVMRCEGESTCRSVRDRRSPGVLRGRSP